MRSKRSPRTEEGDETRTRLAVAWGLAKQQQIPFDDLEPFVAELKATWNVAGHRLQHIDNAPPDQEWELAVA